MYMPVFVFGMCVCMYMRMYSNGERGGEGERELCCASFALVVFFHLLRLPRDFTHSDVRLGSSGSRWEGKQQGRRGPDLEGMPGRKAAGNWFLWEAHGRELGSRSQVFWEVQGNRRCLVRVSIAVTKHHD